MAQTHHYADGERRILGTSARSQTLRLHGEADVSPGALKMLDTAHQGLDVAGRRSLGGSAASWKVFHVETDQYTVDGGDESDLRASIPPSRLSDILTHYGLPPSSSSSSGSENSCEASASKHVRAISDLSAPNQAQANSCHKGSGTSGTRTSSFARALGQLPPTTEVEPVLRFSSPQHALDELNRYLESHY
eukprot:TRINITY_DN76781_c0_g1_i1.p1 TRINITY_DN76781_c0_g1~~TRINITY_DN76781_c0_g1_i1.p1  ORF type:complete len:203 (+),score=11.49 TRINITY_DN76781_c0_g1_i1:38-610(+)